MNKKILLYFSLLIFFSAESQNFDSVPGGKFNGYPEAIFCDSIHNELIVSSKFINKVGSLPVRGIARWNGIKWDSLMGGINTYDIPTNPTNPGGEVYSGISYNGKLLVGGIFNSMGGIKATSLALWDGTKWDTLPKRAFDFGKAAHVSGLYKNNNLLYIYGQYDTIAGQFTKSLATWDGSNYQPIIIPVNNVKSIYSVLMYNNELYIGGFFYHTSMTDPKNQILKFDGLNWQTVGGGIPGTVSRIYCMAIYSNELYVGGRFLKSDGNIGENIQKWDGIQWRDVGFGGELFGAVYNMQVYHNKLWVSGAFNTAAYMPATSVAVYDGTKWCIPQDSLDNGVSGLAVYKDTLFVGGGFNTVNGISMKYLVKLKNENLLKQCNGVGIKENNFQNNISVFPNPTSNSLYISTEQNEFENSEIEISNTLGQSVLKLQFKNEIDVSVLVPGFYNLKITRTNGQLHSCKFIRE